MPTLTEVTFAHRDLSPDWRAAVVILTTAFERDRRVWACVNPGVSIDMRPVLADTARKVEDRLLLALAQLLADDGSISVSFKAIKELDDVRLRLVLDALGIARGSLPVD